MTNNPATAHYFDVMSSYPTSMIENRKKARRTMEENNTPATTQDTPAKPTRNQLRAHNRGKRLDKGWANKCPACSRPFTSAGGLQRHLADYHRVNVEIKVRP